MFHQQLSLSSQPHQAHLCSDLQPQAPGSWPPEPTAASARLPLNPSSALHAFGTGKQQNPSLPQAASLDHQPHPACGLTGILRLEGENAQHLPCIPASPLPSPAYHHSVNPFVSQRYFSAKIQQLFQKNLSPHHWQKYHSLRQVMIADSGIFQKKGKIQRGGGDEVSGIQSFFPCQSPPSLGDFIFINRISVKFSLNPPSLPFQLPAELKGAQE